MACGVVFLLSFSICLALVYRYYQTWGINASLGLCALLIAIGTLIVAIFSLRYTRRSLELTTSDIKTRVRPFVSVHKFRREYERVLSQWTFSVVLQNTGSVPAVKVNVKLLFLSQDLTPFDDGRFDKCPLLAPEGEYMMIYVNILTEILELMNKDGAILQVNVDYEGMSEHYKTKQTFKVNRCSPSVELVVRPVEPSFFT